MNLLVLFFLFVSISFAQTMIDPDPVPAPEGALVLPGEIPPDQKSEFEKAVENAKPLPPAEVKKTESMPSEMPTARSSLTSRELRETTHHTGLIGYEFISSWIPSKKLISYSYNNNADWAFKLEYSTASLSTGIIGVDLGKIEEKRYSLLAQRFFGNSFHFDFGPYYTQIKARAGGKILSSIPETEVASFSVNALGAAVGLGNRWQWENGITFGIDWLRLNIPLLVTDSDTKIIKNIPDEGKSDDVKNVIEYFGRVPTFSILGIHLGYTF